MPFYVWECEKCEGPRTETFEHKPEPKAPLCGGCGERMAHDLMGEARSGVEHVPASGFPYVTKHITGKPIEVKSARHLESLCKQHNVTHRPDAAWIDKRFEGYDWAQKRYSYKESTGMGMPGVWV